MIEFSDGDTYDLKNGDPLPEMLRVGIQCARNASQFAHPRRSGLHVGAAVLDEKEIFSAAGNVEVLWQRSYHAEENAIVSALGRGSSRFGLIVVSAPRKLFTPCGGCCDLILEFASPNCLFIHDNPETEVATLIKASALMPFYPTRS